MHHRSNHPARPRRLRSALRRTGVLVAATTALATATLGLAAPASAGIGGPPAPANAGIGGPPATDGYVHYGPPLAHVSCTGGVPTSVNFSFDYDASDYRGTAENEATLKYVADGGTRTDGGTVSVPITAGTTGTFAHVFPVDAPAGTSFAAIRVHPSGSFDPYVTADFPLACTERQRVVAPTVSISPVKCDGSYTLTYDGTEASQLWYGASVYDPINGASAHGLEIVPGKVVTEDLTILPGKDYILAYLNSDYDNSTTHEGFVANAFPVKLPANCTSPTATTTTVGVSPNAATDVPAVLMYASVSPSSAGGTVSFTNGDAAVPGCEARPVNADSASFGYATCVTTVTKAGPTTIGAIYSGDTTHAASTSSVPVTVSESADFFQIALGHLIAFAHNNHLLGL